MKIHSKRDLRADLWDVARCDYMQGTRETIFLGWKRKKIKQRNIDLEKLRTLTTGHQGKKKRKGFALEVEIAT